ncbi:MULTISPECIES: ubiquinone-dependent pyruvate dehydrogenase [Rhodococcus]|uniref:ubiquinone-dependent pyruvate dehydrogenase n=1 Tax=Rhodococcus TaxID=1827 RepID=UPI001E599603|nr:ubiquinone-dependent pyruvate dehydrogenase [Rhodococcus pyridinivorans]MCD2115652.1 ubiquinone-dependent pyruvate dehydrogenase [Rhodococcus pyridinivorans]MCZ4624127.1 ubiquinone-dependent pyruvate dehydrogenase [Rhodococcus pyridinivorans]MCZ4645339.1 ubiquinone-dependent pyruvate dehydrogenase [Rhodococcus pyridinivorans]MDJ0481892.1 ubiquinone-dependent pyruvate dehydrogenase [Rhodococcus pyridinivorans]MDV7251443.1 ubiquinone-dependent pyruvate dehydrogenase [Rhodococcus pyridinivoran
MTTVAENIVASLRANGVERVYGIPGDSLNGFTDALRRDGTIRWMHVRHEESAAFAAAAEAALTGELAVVAGSCGPGNLHLINGLFDAHRSRVPVLAIAAHIPTSEIGTNYFQETHPQELFRECSSYVEYVADPAQMPRVLEIAMRTAVEEQGVAVVVIPGDVALADAVSNRTSVIRRANPTVVPSDAELDRAAELLNAAKRVTILAGAGAAGSHDEVIALADRLNAPIVHALRGKEHIEYDNPFDVGMTGLLGFASGYRAMDASDAVLMLGTDFPYPQFYPDHAKTIQVDIRGSQLGRRHPLDLGLVGDVGATAAALVPRLNEGRDRSHLDDAREHYLRTRAKLDELAVPRRGSEPIHPQYLTRLIDEAAADDAVFTADVGSPTVWAARYLTMNGRRRLIGSFSHGSMANALMHGIGAQTAAPGRQVVALAGDGGLAMMLGELITLTQNELPVKTVVYNNASLNFVELEMKAAGFVTYGTGLSNPNFADVAAALGIRGIRVERSDELPDAVAEFLAHDGPAVLDVVTERQELSMPPNVTAKQVGGFALYALRTVMSGRGDELLDLARANWRQLL